MSPREDLSDLMLSKESVKNSSFHANLTLEEAVMLFPSLLPLVWSRWISPNTSFTVSAISWTSVANDARRSWPPGLAGCSRWGLRRMRSSRRSKTAEVVVHSMLSKSTAAGAPVYMPIRSLRDRAAEAQWATSPTMAPTRYRDSAIATEHDDECRNGSQIPAMLGVCVIDIVNTRRQPCVAEGAVGLREELGSAIALRYCFFSHDVWLEQVCQVHICSRATSRQTEGSPAQLTNRANHQEVSFHLVHVALSPSFCVNEPVVIEHWTLLPGLGFLINLPTEGAGSDW